jgi:16S rRNA (cytosine1407-C5)-methyltransferase
MSAADVSTILNETAQAGACALLPAELQERTARLIPDRSLADIFGQPQPIALRANTLKTTPGAVRALLEDAGFVLAPISWYDAAFVVLDGQQRALTDLPEYHAGHFYIQNLSSMIPALVLDPQPDERILDLTAAPGSKTTQLATLMNNTGEILANDLSRTRVFRLRANLEQQGVTNTHTQTAPGELVWQKYPEYFDRVLIDAPCTMEGRISCADSESYADWSLKKIKKLARRQQFLLRSAISACKPGGTVVYSTCTMAPEENEAVINWLLEKEGDAVEVSQIAVKGIPGNPGLMSWDGTTYRSDVSRCLRIVSQAPYEGFFVAKITKLRPTVGF